MSWGQVRRVIHEDRKYLVSNALRSSENNLQAWPLVTFLRSVLLVWGDKSLIGVDSRKNGRNKGRERKRGKPFSRSVAVKGSKKEGGAERRNPCVCILIRMTQFSGKF